EALGLRGNDLMICGAWLTAGVNLSTRASNCLRRKPALTLADVLALTIDDLFHIPNMGRTSIQEVLVRVQEFIASGGPGVTGGNEPDTVPGEVDTDETGLSEVSLDRLDWDVPLLVVCGVDGRLPDECGLPLSLLNLCARARNCLSATKVSS